LGKTRTGHARDLAQPNHIPLQICIAPTCADVSDIVLTVWRAVGDAKKWPQTLLDWHESTWSITRHVLSISNSP
jgi:hypothetical protein